MRWFLIIVIVKDNNAYKVRVINRINMSLEIKVNKQNSFRRGELLPFGIGFVKASMRACKGKPTIIDRCEKDPLTFILYNTYQSVFSMALGTFFGYMIYLIS